MRFEHSRKKEESDPFQKNCKKTLNLNLRKQTLSLELLNLRF